MNKVARRLLSGASFAALSFGLPTTAVKAGIIVNTAAHGPVTVLPFQVTDYISVTTPGIVNGDILNEGFVINKATETIAIQVGPGASVTDDILNEGFILAHGIGIFDAGNVGGNISNTANGNIIVVNTNLAGRTIAGIEVIGDLGGGIYNSGSINVIGTGKSGKAYGIAAAGVLTDLFFTAHNKADGTMLVVDAFNSAGANVSVNAYGIALHASSDMGVSLTNSGKMTITAVGAGKTVSASAIGVTANNGGNTDGSTNNFARFTNAGSLKVVAAASATIYAHATAEGVRLDVDGGGASQVNATFNNQTSAHLTVSAAANGPAGVSALAIGVQESAVDAVWNARASAQNDGAIHVVASASGSNANAEARGVSQEAGAVNTGFGFAQDFFNNQGKLTVLAHADGSGNAYAQGVRQTVTGAPTGRATLTNGGNIYVSAHGIGDIAQASALGVKQTVSVNWNGQADFFNSGNLTVIASAVGSKSAHAKATGIKQFIDPPFDATASLTNTSNGSIKVTAFAKATTHATATANGVSQHVSAILNANANVYNQGLIDVTAHASAANPVTPAATATAKALVGHGILQSVLATDIRARITNNTSATINIGAHAYASATLVANAHAKISDGIAQFAESAGGTIPEEARVNLTNYGDISILARATATKAQTANATALIAAGIRQFAQATSDASAIIYSPGNIGITAHAIAHGTSNANALASVSYGIAQHAQATGFWHTRAQVSLENGGTINIKALATATGSNTAIATAIIQHGVSEVAFGGKFASASVSNFGSGKIDIEAHALASGQSAYDVAKINTGFYESANASGGNFARAGLRNTEFGQITVLASAVAKGSGQASAWGTLNYGINQKANDALSAEAFLSNNGIIHLTAAAHAEGNGVDASTARAYADMVFGVFQSASATGGPAARATANLSNEGTLDIVVRATATGSQIASAYAHLSDWGIYQHASNAGDAHVTINNGGNISIEALAHALGDAKATAIIGSGGGASSAGIRQSAIGAFTAVASISNHDGGQINIIAKATAIDSAGGNATANGWIKAAGIEQIAGSADKASVELHNTAGTIAIAALAFASAPTGAAKASAFVSTGIHQVANATGTAKATLHNGGLIDILAKATATATGNVTASAHVVTGIKQEASGATAATVLLDNTGVINIEAFAYAKGDAHAFAAIGSGNGGGGNSDVGIYQHATAITAANVTLSNHGAGHINILAKATAIDTQGGPATATAQITPYGIYQHASAEQANVKLSNTGFDAAIHISALAFASATGGNAFANAAIDTGLFQDAFAVTGLGFAKDALINDGTLDIVAKATAKGAGFASASAFISAGVSQRAQGGLTASVQLNNGGQLAIEALAKATAASAVAQASMTNYELYQWAAAGDGLLASAKLTNGPDATLQILANASAHGNTNGHAFAHANLSDGIGQFARSAKTAIDFLSNDGGNIFITAKAHASAPSNGGASAYAFMVDGIYQYASADGNKTAHATASLINSGNIGVAVDAIAQGGRYGQAIAQATLGGWGIYQQATNAGVAHAGIDNSGDIEIVAHAHASGGGGATLYALAQIGVTSAAAGIFQSASALNNASTASVDLTNEAGGKIEIVAEATARTETWSGNPKAIALINGYGIHQVAGGASNEGIKLDNSGLINIVADANAFGSWTAGNASAHAYIYDGIYQHALVSGGSGHILLTNADGAKINVIASAHGTGQNNGKAAATVSYGISQSVQFATTAFEQIDNGGTIVIAANANAHGWNNSGVASANVWFGIGQFASASFGNEATAALTNSGKITIEAFAHASGPTKAVAGALVDTGIRQDAYGPSNARAELENSGSINIAAIAHAQGDAFAHATIQTGIRQTASAGGTHLFATAQITNTVDANINILAHATATGGVATASAVISDFGIYQVAESANVAKALITNAGTLSITAHALANATALGAHAFAAISSVGGKGKDGTGIFQSAHATSSGDTAEALISNLGKIDIAANATAHGMTKATATATVHKGIYQYAYDAGKDIVRLSGAGTVDILAHAIATAASGPAIANANIGYGIYQSAYAYSGNNHTSAIASISVSGGAAEAYAQATGKTAQANANLNNYGIYQRAYDAATDKVSFVNNSGEFLIGAIAHAHATTGKAYADGYVDYGIYQEAYGSHTPVLASVNLTNKADATLAIVGSGRATGVTKATAYGYNYYGIEQYADNALSASVKLDNSGTLDVEAIAHANAKSGTAYAYAYIYSAVYQSAYGNGASGANASVALTNAGIFDIVASAKATGTTNVLASAYINNHGIYQGAYDADTAKVSLKNTGTLDIEALAHAQGDAKAYAFVSYGIYQNVYATNNNLSAIASITNGANGLINIVAAATAHGGIATATAIISNTGIYQHAYSADVAKALITNAGTINIEALAKATATTGNAVAHASIGHTATWFAGGPAGAGIYQSAIAASNDVSALAAISNADGAKLNIVAEATAFASSGKATASADIFQYGIYQNASNANIAKASIQNAGTLIVAADAKATALSGTAVAHATIANQSIWGAAAAGIYQTAQATFSGATAEALINNSGKIAIEANATAHGTAKATASAYVNWGISQFATNYGGHVSAKLNGGGTVDILANAIATAASGPAKAYASIITGIYQDATNNNGAFHTSALASISIGGGAIEAFAKATGITANASAYIDVYGIYQNAEFADSDRVTFVNNSGAFVIGAIAQADATSGKGYAYAYMDYGIYQYAYASSSDLLATANITNAKGATLAIVANAKATGATTATAHAYNEYGIYQYAENAKTVSAKLDNSGTLDIAAIAKADATTGGAFASAYMYNGIYQYASGTGSATNVASVSLDNGFKGTGTLAIIASAHATGLTGAKASASIDDYGIYQYAFSAGNVNAAIHNDGLIDIAAIAHAKATSGTAKAYATMSYGIYQYIYALGTTSNQASALIDNNNGKAAINILASAQATGLTGATASATISEYGIYQEAYNGDTVKARIENQGTLDIAAIAHAKATSGTAVANATIDYGIYQYAYGRGVAGDVVTASITVGKQLNIIASAKATGLTGATANATIDGTGIYQYAYKGATVNGRIINNGSFNIAAIAHAKATSGAAIAVAGIDTGIEQIIYGNGTTGDVVHASIVNNGTMNILASAHAIGLTGATATATISDYGIYQYAHGGDTVVAKIDGSGAFNIAAIAGAKATSANAVAKATIDTGIYQYAYARGVAGDVATASITDGKALNILASARATGLTGATASASITNYGIYQYVYGGATVNAKIENSGSFNIAAIAHAKATSAVALAYATIPTGIYQYAYANGTKGDQVTAAIINGGAMNILANAQATGLSGATASASITDYGIYQYVYNADTVKAKIDSSGTLAIAAIAKAVATSGAAHAYATIGTAGIYQYVYGLGKAGDQVTASITAGKALNIVASAHATGLTGATASATITDAGIYQYAYNGATVNAKIENNGSFNIAAIAYAKATSGAAYAHATMSYGIYQNAYANGTSGDKVNVAITNKGTMNIVASAHAIGTATVTASASISEYGIYQRAYNADTANVSLKNTGTLNIAALAHASGDAKAYAYIATGIYQSAHPTNLQVAATAQITNGANAKLNIIADATATGSKATASAYISDYGIYQYAYSANVVKAEITNAGTINIMAHALANATKSAAHAYAIIGTTDFSNGTGIYQKAAATYSGASELALIANTGKIAIEAAATAHGMTAANATAYVLWGISQYATDHGGKAAAKITGNGVVAIAAIASATAKSGPAKGYASIITGIYQSVSNYYGGKHTSALASIAVDGGAVEAFALAKGTTATATANIKEYGIYQVAEYANTDTVKLENSGDFDIAAIAHATATKGTASASAEIHYGIYQYAYGYYYSHLAADAAITNGSGEGGGLLAIVASAKASGVKAANATATIDYGIYQEAEEAQQAHAKIFNSGVLDVAAIASAQAKSGPAVANASLSYTGIYQYASADIGSQTSAVVALTNSGTLGVEAIAAAKGTNAVAHATVDEYGIYQEAYYADTADVTLKNTGSIGIEAIAHATATKNTATAYAYLDYGIYQYADASNDELTANVAISGDGNLAIVASAKASGVKSANATAYNYYGIEQQAYGGGEDSAKITGGGSIVIAAVASALAKSGPANAKAYIDTGIYQYVTAYYGSHTSAVASIAVDGGAIEAFARAKGTTALATASITAYGVYQYAYYGSTDSVRFENSGAFDIAAIAHATATKGTANAKAFIETGIYQYAYAASYSHLAANVALTNGDGDGGGALAIVASAKASGVKSANATATMYYGISQYAYEGGLGSAKIFNSGALDIAVIASALAKSGPAHAYATNYTGIYQYVTAYYGGHTSAAVNLTNLGTLGIDVIAKAKGTAATASATIDKYGIYQYAYYGDTDSITLNNSGTLDIAALAQATATKGTANANAYIDYGIYQYAYASYNELAANVAINGDGKLAIVASAKASGVSAANATAELVYGIYQQAYDGGQDGAKITGGQQVTIAAIASAKAASGFANASASISYTGIYQDVTANYGNHTSAVASIDVHGGGVLAIANAKGTAASAHATIDEYGVYQYAYYGDNDTARFRNTGTFDIAAIANATATQGFAKAYAYNDVGIYQTAYASHNELAVSAAVTNDGGTLAIVANAQAIGATGASATAYMYYGISQYAENAKTAHATVDNEEGSIVIEVAAKAVATTGNAHAYAIMHTGIYQIATGNGTTGANAAAAISNAGTLAIVANASATGTAKVTASAYINDYGIYQSVYNADTVKASIYNSGTLDIAALAHASGDAFAYAYIPTGIYQAAYATNKQVSATVAITNAKSAVMDIVAQATAIAANGNATASAYISDYGIYQYAHNADVANASIHNAGTLAIMAKASAKAATGAADAYAIIGTTEFDSGTGIYQSASVTGNQVSAKALIDNSGAISIVADAVAHGATSANATAYVLWGISQYALNGGQDSAKIIGGGSVDIAAIASASATAGPANAYASIITGIYQSATAYYGSHTRAVASIDVGGGAVEAFAKAKGTTAVASAYIDDYGIYQYAYGGDTDTANFNNDSGKFIIGAVADATATKNFAHAYAYVDYGIYQYAYASNGEVAANVALSNGGTLAIIASAKASGVTGASATAYNYYGIAQYAEDASKGSVKLDNNGTLDIAAIASAVAANGKASAYASMYTGITQYASAYYSKHLSAVASLTNGANGVLAIDAVAKANGTSASATAYIDEYGIYQVAYYGNKDKVSLQNSGSLGIAAIATATASKGFASAYAYLDVGIYQYAYASYAENSAAVTLSNNAGGKLIVAASANASGVTKASATAYNYYAIEQYAENAKLANVSLNNSGTMALEVVANAKAAKGTASAYAFMYTGIEQYASANSTTGSKAGAALANAGKLQILAAASAVGTQSVSANASIDDYGIYQYAHGADTANVSLNNSGTLAIEAIAFASGDAFANAYIDYGIYQHASATNKQVLASASLSNVTVGTKTAVLNVVAMATAKGTAAKGAATASATISQGIYQEANQADVGNDSLHNSGDLLIAAIAKATAAGTANAIASNHGVLQSVLSVGDGNAVIVNDGHFEDEAAAFASGNNAAAVASAIGGASQHVTATGSALDGIVNAGTFLMLAFATAKGGASAAAKAYASGGHQNASGNKAFASIFNSGTYEAVANASAVGNQAAALASAFGPLQSVLATKHAEAEFTNANLFMVQGNATALGGASGVASAFASGLSQHAIGGTAAVANFENSGIYQVGAEAKATGNIAHAYASDRGVYQSASNAGANATVQFINDSDFHVHAKATASGGASGFALAVASGVHQFLSAGGNATLHNAATFVVSAKAVAHGSKAASATASALGAQINAGSTAALSLDVVNSGIFYVLASANDAVAFAAGLVVDGDSKAKVSVSGDIENDGLMQVSAKAPGGSAQALGIGVFGDQFTGTITNKGTLYVFAKGALAQATGIAIGNQTTTGAAGTGTILNQGGTIWAGVSNGVVTLRGTAIDVTGAPNTIVIDLEGNGVQNGFVYGDIKLSANNNDTINVINGKTVFDGGINPDGDLFGTLNVGGGTSAGTLDFVHNPVEGQAYAYVNVYNQFSDGTLSIHVDPSPDPAFVFIHANDATLAGTIKVDFAPGLYAGDTVYRVVLSTDPLSGTWDHLVSNLQSLFLVPTAVYTTFEADIDLKRIAFNSIDAVPSLAHNHNEFEVASGLEHSYSTSLTGPYANLIKALLQVGDENEFQHLMDVLSGEEAGETALANLDAADILKDAVSGHLQAILGDWEQLSMAPSSIMPAAGGTTGRVSFWGGAFGHWGSTDNTKSGPGFNSDMNGLVAGADVAVGPSATLGIAGTWTAHGGLDFDNRNSGNFTGYQLGAYGRYNAGDVYYLQGLASYGEYSNDTRRFVAVPGFGAGNVRGSFDSRVWDLYGEGGYHINTNSSVDLVPYVALDYLHGSSGSYTETGLPGANLHVNDASATSFSSFLGAKLSLLDRNLSDSTSIVPTVKLAWQHEFDKNIWTVDAAFAGVPASAFKVTGAGLSKDSLVTGGEIALRFGDNVDAVIDYEGRFGSDRQNNTVIGRLNFRL